MADDPKYIWLREDWQNMTYDAAALQEDFSRLAAKAGELTGLRSAMSKYDRADTFVNEITDEAVASYAIEGEHMDKGQLVQSVVSSMLRRAADDVGKDARGKEYHNVAEIMLDARNPKPLTQERLDGWHQKMFDDRNPEKMAVGRLRDSRDMQVISQRHMGAVPTVHYEAPQPEQLRRDMAELIEWIDRTRPGGPESLPAPARAALAHLKFETIHPYDDGNGRIGRAIADYVISQSPDYQRSAFSLSRAIQGDKAAYYDALKDAQSAQRESAGPNDQTAFVKYFASAMDRALDHARDEARYITGRNAFFAEHGDKLNERQETALRRLFKEGRERVEQGLSSGPYQRITKASPATATRDLADLAEKGVLTQNSEARGRSVNYRINVSFGDDQPERSRPESASRPAGPRERAAASDSSRER